MTASRESAIEMRKQGPAARRLPFQGGAKLAGVHADQQQTALTGKMLRSGLRNLGRGRKMDEIVAAIDLGAAKYASAFGFACHRCGRANFVTLLNIVTVRKADPDRTD